MKLTCKGCIDERTCMLGKTRCKHYTRVRKDKWLNYTEGYMNKMEVAIDGYILEQKLNEGALNRWIRERVKYG